MSFEAVALTMLMVVVAPASVQPLGAHATAEMSLPSGSSDEFRTRMIDWSAVPQGAPFSAKEGPGPLPAVRLDSLAISSRFGWRDDPMTGVGRRHAGIDLPSRRGSAVRATAPGVVRIAGWVGGYGNLVEIEHSGGVSTRYGHLSRLDVAPAQHVEEGQVIGEVGSTGHSTGPHLHFEVRVRGYAVDPLTFVGQRAPAVGTVWGAELHALSKWTWRTGVSDEALPEVSLR
jgi:murein DD-endopeptidase MepM/ murein hydrolase activator NlpD